jgi:hypothetical protein
MTETVIPELHIFNTKYHNSSQVHHSSLKYHLSPQFTKIPLESTVHNYSQIYHIVHYNITQTHNSLQDSNHHISGPFKL